MSKTVKETFRDAIANGNWKEIQRVYKVITGETAPEPPKQPSPKDSLQSLLDQPLSAMRSRSVDPMDEPMEEEEEDAEDELIQVPDDPGPLLGNAGAALAEEDPAPITKPDSAVSAEDFSIKHGTFDGDRTTEDGKVKCKREPMNIPDSRPNLFRDNGKAFSDEKVTENPGDPSLGIQSIRQRSAVRDATLGANTGKKTQVKCGLCNKEEVVASSLAVGFHVDPMHNTYRCNTCTSPNGRAKVLREQREAQLNGGTRRR